MCISEKRSPPSPFQLWYDAPTHLGWPTWRPFSIPHQILPTSTWTFESLLFFAFSYSSQRLVHGQTGPPPSWRRRSDFLYFILYFHDHTPPRAPLMAMHLHSPPPSLHRCMFAWDPQANLMSVIIIGLADQTRFHIDLNCYLHWFGYDLVRSKLEYSKKRKRVKSSQNRWLNRFSPALIVLKYFFIF